MSVYRPKTRIISFRASEDEYELLRQISLNEGAQSVSDYCRATLCRIAAEEMERANAGTAGLDQRIWELDRAVRRLHGLLERERELSREGN